MPAGFSVGVKRIPWRASKWVKGNAIFFRTEKADSRSESGLIANDDSPDSSPVVTMAIES